MKPLQAEFFEQTSIVDGWAAPLFVVVAAILVIVPHPPTANEAVGVKFEPRLGQRGDLPPVSYRAAGELALASPAPVVSSDP